MPPIDPNESRVEEASTLLMELFEQAEADPIDVIAACVDVICTQAELVPGLDRETVLDWAVHRMD